MKPFLTVMNLVPVHVHFSFSTINTSIYQLTSYAQSQSLLRFPFGTVLYQSLHPSGAPSSCLAGLPFHLSGEHTFCSSKGAHLFSRALDKFLPPYFTSLFHKYVIKTYYMLGNVLSWECTSEPKTGVCCPHRTYTGGKQGITPTKMTVAQRILLGISGAMKVYNQVLNPFEEGT